jgi:hypothetical protein
MDRAPRTPVGPESVRALRPGHGANCSSIGSVVDTLFVTALLGGALFAAVLGALDEESVEVVGPEEAPREKDRESSKGDAPPEDTAP